MGTCDESRRGLVLRSLLVWRGFRLQRTRDEETKLWAYEMRLGLLHRRQP